MNIAETGGYLNKGTKEDIYKAVSDIRKCFLKLQCTAGYKNEAEEIQKEDAGKQHGDGKSRNDKTNSDISRQEK